VDKRARVRAVLRALDGRYPGDGRCFLDFGADYELLMAVILSAQCTDARVNLVTEGLFARYGSLEEFAAADLGEMEELVRPCGFFRTKARHLIGSAQAILRDFGGRLPDCIDALTSLPGVGRKTANVIRGHIFGLPAVVVDTHVMRLSRRWGFTKNTCPVKIEFDLMKILPKSAWLRFNQQTISFGREICKAQKPLCNICEMSEFCPKIMKIGG